ncbi:lysozyme inhibitor LprI family protein [Paraburkholderia sp. MPAMCS5]|uniref:lysozyme inhibitor LprI family protein n=1 Tax=Paraburkholderia sp. MPAMCS5 TaxID=3112563 RepID=UPI002E198DFD|nr:lysozyme inhibitor LprI family protein [Paraburkholderia sp. MPAMCS5]
MNKLSRLLISCCISGSLLCTVAKAATASGHDACAAAEETGVTATILDCLGTENSKADKRLNAVYKSTMARLDASGKERLRNEERQWIKVRDAKCNAAGKEFDGGSLQQVEQSSCFVDATKERVHAIEGFH